MKLTNMISPLYQPKFNNNILATEGTPSNDSSSIGGIFPSAAALKNLNFGNLRFADILGTDDISYINDVMVQGAKKEDHSSSPMSGIALETSDLIQSEEGSSTNRAPQHQVDSSSQEYVNIDDVDAYSFEESKSGLNGKSLDDGSGSIESDKLAELTLAFTQRRTSEL